MDLALNSLLDVHAPSPGEVESIILPNLIQEDFDKICLELSGGRFPNLKKIWIKSDVETIPDCFWEMTGLEHLVIQDVNIQSVPKGVFNLKNLKTLEISHTSVRHFELPDNDASFLNLTKLALADNDLESVPDLALFGPGLEYVDLSINALTYSDCSIQMTNLKYLNLGNNNLKVLPAWIYNCINLEVLKLRRNRLYALHSRIHMLTNLRILELQFNWFSFLPIEIRDLPNLNTLLARGNPISYIPDFSKMINLRCLDLRETLLVRVPVELTKSNLDELRLCDGLFDQKESDEIFKNKGFYKSK